MRRFTFGMVCSVALCTVVYAQPFFYNATKDQIAQQAEAAAKAIANGVVFDKEIQNLDLLSKLQIQRTLAMGEAQYRAAVNAFVTWKNVSEQPAKVETGLTNPSQTLTVKQVDERLKDVDKEVAAIKDKLDAIGKTSGDANLITEIQHHIETADSVLAFAKSLPTDNLEFTDALAQIKTWLGTAKTLYNAFAAAMEARRAMSKTVAAFAVPVELEQLKLLHLETEQLKWIGANEARRQAGGWGRPLWTMRCQRCVKNTLRGLKNYSRACQEAPSDEERTTCISRFLSEHATELKRR